MNPLPQSRWLVLAERIYGSLLRLYPAGFRRDYEALMLQLFRDVSRARYPQQGLPGMALWWCRTLLDLVFTVIEERRKEKFTMSKSMFMQIAGLLLMVGGAFGMVAAFSQLQPGGLLRYSGIYQVLLLLLAPSFLFIGLGCIGLALRYRAAHGALGQVALIFAGVGSLMMALGTVLNIATDSLGNGLFTGGLLHVITLLAFGLLHARKPTLPIFRWLPLQIAAGWLMLSFFVSPVSSNLLAFLLTLGVGLAWFAIGQAVHRQPLAQGLAAA